MRPQPDERIARALRLWLGTLAVLLMAALPGPVAPERSGLPSHFSLARIEPALVTQQAGAVVLRHEAVQLRPLPAATKPPCIVPVAPSAPATLLLAGVELVLPASRSPPTARARAPPLS
ncbi:hypothetical protein RGQ15_01455 [Paracoccus sp. MBLB3053]|uniref:DUF2946 domain-containing protein n=1 Tax=Paracoccus aurantius TaxID=3073814 RepID=A0ABU2HNN1_9RHOB|nr:hypothetical protein [Paracoccus sp. MBLB3053]MDS9466239.1 hypothetical protein [Paracoccus sp. MBLB3053]